LALNQIRPQAKQRGITPDEVVKTVMMGSVSNQGNDDPIGGWQFICDRFFKAREVSDRRRSLLFDGGMAKKPTKKAARGAEDSRVSSKNFFPYSN